MKTQKTCYLLGWSSIILSTTASFCCIAPVLAFIAGVSWIASVFSWLHPVRPYLIVITVLVLGLAWYKKLKPKKAEIECACETDEKPSFLQTRAYLGIVTVFSALMITFPYYSHIFYPKTKSEVVVVEQNNLVQANFDIKGMTCNSCEENVKRAVSQLLGSILVEADHKTGKAMVKFDKSKTSLE